MSRPLTLHIDGPPRTVQVGPRALPGPGLRNELNPPGIHIGCDTSQAGIRVVHIDGLAVKNCTAPAAHQRAGA